MSDINITVTVERGEATWKAGCAAKAPRITRALLAVLAEQMVGEITRKAGLEDR